MGLDELVEMTQGVLDAHSMSPEVRKTPECVLYRCEGHSDRHVEVVLREKGWTLSYVHLPTRRTVRLRGKDSVELERQLTPLCLETAYEPPDGTKQFLRFG